MDSGRNRSLESVRNQAQGYLKENRPRAAELIREAVGKPDPRIHALETS